MSAWLPAVLAAGTVLLLMPAPRRLPVPSAPAADRPTSASDSWRWAAAAGTGIGAWVVVGDLPGAILGPAVTALMWWWLGRLEAPALIRRREQLVEQLPTTVDLVAACLDAGRPPGPTLRIVGTALGGPIAEELARCCHRLDLGGDPASVWSELATHPQLGPLGRTFARAHESGASVAEAVHHLADDLRAAGHAAVEARARRLEVKVALPLGVCLLPAFVLLGIVPMVVGLFGSIELL